MQHMISQHGLVAKINGKKVFGRLGALNKTTFVFNFFS